MIGSIHGRRPATLLGRNPVTHEDQLRQHVEAAAAALGKSGLSSPLLRTARRELAKALRVLGWRQAAEPAEAIRSALDRIEAGKAEPVGDVEANLRKRLTAAGRIA